MHSLVRPPVPFVTSAGRRVRPCSTTLLLRIRSPKCSSLACSPATPGPYRTRRTADLSPATRPLKRARTPTPRRERRIFCDCFLLSWGFEEDGRGRGHGHGGGESSHPHGEALHGSKSGRGKARWCGAGGHRELQPSHLHAHACSIQSLQKMSCGSEGSRCWVDNGYISPVNDGQRKKSNLKKCSEESQLRVADWLMGRGRRVCAAARGAGAGAGRARRRGLYLPGTVCKIPARVQVADTGDLAGRMRGCRGRLYLMGTGDIVGRRRNGAVWRRARW